MRITTPLRPGSRRSSALAAVVALLTGTMAAALPAAPAAAATCFFVDDSSYGGQGNGTPQAPFTISDATELAKVGEAGCLSLSYVQTDDITLSGPWTPIGSSATPFTGVYDGAGHTISGLTIDLPSASNVGLFGRSEGTITGVHLVDIDVTGSHWVGGLLGHNNGTGVVEDSSTSGVVDGRGMGFVGGLVGTNLGTIRGSRSSVDVTSQGQNTGGLVGLHTSLTGSTPADKGAIEFSFATGSVTSTTQDVGGLVGSTDGDNTSIVESFARGNVSGTTGVGGLIGALRGTDLTLSRSYSTGLVTATNTGASSGGLVGFRAGGLASFAGIRLYWDENTSGIQTDEAGGEAKTTAEMNAIATFVGWVIEETCEVGGFDPLGGPPAVWGICPTINDGYPFLRWMSAEPTPVEELEAELCPSGGTVQLIGPIDAAAEELTIDCDVTIDLDGHDLTVRNIIITPGSTLTITDTSADAAGMLTVEAPADEAGIRTTGATLIIENGTVNVTGGTRAAGIGGRNASGLAPAEGSGGTVIINGGTVNAQGGTFSGAGIGGGNLGADGGTVTINGGTVVATGGGSGAGIGGGDGGGQSDRGDGATVEITGGEVIATGGFAAAGIGGGWSGNGGTFTMSGGTVTATGGDGGGAGIGGGLSDIDGSGDGATVTITGGTVTAIGGAAIISGALLFGGGAGIGGGGSFENTGINYTSGGGDGGVITIEGGVVTATAGSAEAKAFGAGGDFDGAPGTLSLGEFAVETIDGLTTTITFVVPVEQSPEDSDSQTPGAQPGVEDTGTQTGDEAPGAQPGGLNPGTQTPDAQAGADGPVPTVVPAGEGPAPWSWPLVGLLALAVAFGVSPRRLHHAALLNMAEAPLDPERRG